MAPRESYERAESAEQYRYRTSLVGLMSLALKPPEFSDPSAKQGWAVKLARKVVSRLQSLLSSYQLNLPAYCTKDEFKNLRSKLPPDKLFKAFEDIDVFLEDALQLARSGDTRTFAVKWPPNLADDVARSFESKNPLGNMARSPLLALAEVASQADRVSWPPTENATSTRFSGSTTPGAPVGVSATRSSGAESQSIVRELVIYSTGAGPASRAIVGGPEEEIELEAPQDPERNYSSRRRISRSLPPCEKVNTIVPHAFKVKRSVSFDRGAAKCADKDGRELYSQLDRIFQQAEELIAAAQSFEKDKTGGEVLMKWRNRAYACIVRILLRV